MRFLAVPIFVALATSALGCVDDSSAPPPITLPDAALNNPIPTATPDGSPPPPDAASGVSRIANTTAGGVVTKSESYRLVTRTGGTPGSGTPSASESFKSKPTLPGKSNP